MTGYNNQSVDFVQLLSRVWLQKVSLLLVALPIFGSGVLYSLLAPDLYTAEVLVVRNGLGAMPGGASEIGGLASLAGININGDQDMITPAAVLGSRQFTGEYIERHDLLPILFSGEWGRKQEKWTNEDPDDVPDVRDGIRLFEEEIRVLSEDRKTGLITLAVTWTDPIKAAEWANGMIADVNSRLRSEAEREASARLQYLTEQLAGSPASHIQLAVSKMLEKEMEQLLLVRQREEFAFKIVDRATVPKRKSAPNRGLAIVVSIFLGGLAGMIVALGVSRFREPVR